MHSNLEASVDTAVCAPLRFASLPQQRAVASQGPPVPRRAVLLHSARFFWRRRGQEALNNARHQVALSFGAHLLCQRGLFALPGTQPSATFAVFPSKPAGRHHRWRAAICRCCLMSSLDLPLRRKAPGNKANCSFTSAVNISSTRRCSPNVLFSSALRHGKLSAACCGSSENR